MEQHCEHQPILGIAYERCEFLPRSRVAKERQDGFGRQQKRVVIKLDLGPLFLEPGDGQFQRGGIGFRLDTPA